MRLEELRKQREIYVRESHNKKQELAEAQSQIQPLPSEEFRSDYPRPDPYQEPSWFLLISCGLSFVLFLGINELMGISFRNASGGQFGFLTLSFIVAFLAAIGTKKLLSSAAKTSHQQELLADRAARGRQNFAWWVKLAQGNAAVYLGLFLIALETAFGLPGLLGLLPPSMAANPLFVGATIAGGSFFGVTNVALGYFVGIEMSISQANLQAYDRQLADLKASPQEATALEYNRIYAPTVAKCAAAIDHLATEIKRLDLEIAKIEWESKNEEDRSTGDTFNSDPIDSSHHDISSGNTNSKATILS